MSVTARRVRAAPASDPKQPRRMRVLGPGLITGASDDDPSGIATYSQAGAQFGFAISWTMLFSYPLMVAIQQISARIGRTTGKGIAGNLRQHYPNWLLQGIVALLLVANTINIGADLGAMADALRLLMGGPSLIYVIAFGALCAILQVFMAYARYVAVLKWLTLALFAYFGTVMVVDIPWTEAARGFLIPTFLPDAAFWTTVVAVLGTTISPYMFFWITSQEVQEEAEHEGSDLDDDPVTAPGAERNRRIDVITGMGYANVVFYFIVLANAATLGARGVKIRTAAQAAQALSPIVGRFDTILFAVGLIGAGLIAIPVLAGSAAYPLAELFGWREGLESPLRRAPGFYAALSAAIVVGVVFNFLGVDPVKALVYAAVLQGFLAPILLVLLTLVARDASVMGPHRSGRFDSTFGFLAAGVMGAAAIALVVVTLAG